MNETQAHDLHNFMQQISQEMASEYRRIQDPGTAGDQGEENWAELLRGWIPSNYEGVTKGRIISQDGRTSPQVDVVVGLAMLWLRCARWATRLGLVRVDFADDKSIQFSLKPLLIKNPRAIGNGTCCR